MGCFVHVILLGVGCFVSLQKNTWWFSSTYNNGRGGLCPWGVLSVYQKFIRCEVKLEKKKKKKKKKKQAHLLPPLSFSFLGLSLIDSLSPPGNKVLN